MHHMRNEALADVLKVWLYAAASVWLGAWVSPLLYNAGMALAEVSASKTTNDVLEWLAGICRTAGFPDFFRAAVLLAALLLFFPWMEWIHARRGVETVSGPWQVRLPDGARVSGRGQPLEKNPRGLWHGCAGFLLAAGLLLPMGIALVPAGYATMRDPGPELPALLLRSLCTAWAMAALMEVFFRGVAMGIFLRGMRPAAALGMSAAFFAMVISALPPAGVNVADADAPRVGFEMLRLLAARFADGSVVLGEFAPMLALGAVLAYARWRTASLWLPTGLHAGWCFARELLWKLGEPSSAAELPLPFDVFLHGLIPLAAMLVAGVLAHFLTANPQGDHATES
jgi:membrane protease YdiL (CAAX protease family)